VSLNSRLESNKEEEVQGFGLTSHFTERTISNQPTKPNPLQQLSMAVMYTGGVSYEWGTPVVPAQAESVSQAIHPYEGLLVHSQVFQTPKESAARKCLHARPKSEIKSILSHRMYLLISFRKSTPPPNRQLVVYYYELKYFVNGFVGEITF